MTHAVLCVVQSTCVVVSDRPTANQVVSYLQANQAGSMTCKILSELHDRCVMRVNQASHAM